MKTTLKIAFVFVFLSLLIVRPTPSYAYWHDGWHGRGYVDVNLGVWPGPYYYGAPYYYGYPYYGNPYYSAPVVVSSSVVSSSYQPVVVGGVTYYLNNGTYYIYTQYGYQAVAAPAGASAPVTQAATASTVTASASSDDLITINIPNNKGGYNAVILKRSGNGFTGPQGEFYAEFPKVSQLQVMYGK